MNNAKWTWFAIGYQCGFAYVIALMINQFGGAFTGSLNVLGLIAGHRGCSRSSCICSSSPTRRPRSSAPRSDSPFDYFLPKE